MIRVLGYVIAAAFGFLLGVASFSVHATDSKKPSSVDVRLSKQELGAFTEAVREFQKSGEELRNYSVLIRSKGQDIEVVFLPSLGDGDIGLRGGRTQLGREIHYLVSPEGVLMRTTYGR